MNLLLNDFLIEPETDILSALKMLDYNMRGFLIVASKGILQGTLTDGDIRRGLISGRSLLDTVLHCCNQECTYFYAGMPFSGIMETFKNRKISFLPIVNADDVVVNVITRAQMQVLLLYDAEPSTYEEFINIDESLIDYAVHPRPWGFYKTTVLNNLFQSKIISINPKAALSLQYHNRREEYWTIVHGNGIAQIGDSIKPVLGGSSLFIPRGCRHRLINSSDEENLIISEVQIGDYFGEDDIFRIEDRYGRVQT